MADDVRQACANCGCGLDEHHKLRCESAECSGCNGWLCPKHHLVLCGCTYLGGPSPDMAMEDRNG